MRLHPLFDNSGTKKEGVSRTYKGTDGYAPIFAYMGQEGYDCFTVFQFQPVCPAISLLFTPSAARRTDFEDFAKDKNSKVRYLSKSSGLAPNSVLKIR